MAYKNRKLNMENKNDAFLSCFGKIALFAAPITKPHISYLLTYSMVQSPSWEANCFAASQEIFRISRNPKVHYRTHKRSPHVSYPGPTQSSPYTHIPPPGDSS